MFLGFAGFSFLLDVPCCGPCVGCFVCPCVSCVVCLKVKSPAQLERWNFETLLIATRRNDMVTLTCMEKSGRCDPCLWFCRFMAYDIPKVFLDRVLCLCVRVRACVCACGLQEIVFPLGAVFIPLFKGHQETPRDPIDPRDPCPV